MDPGTLALIGSAVAAGGSIGGGFLAGRGSGQETKMERTKRKLVDKLLSSLGGEGPYANLYKTDEGAFQKSFVEPAQAIFRNQIAPQIQQQSIAGGQQRGTGLDDQLLRAGVDLDQMLNQNYLQFQSQGKDRMQNTISSILGGGAGGTQAMSPSQSLMSGVSGYLGSDAFKELTQSFRPKAITTAPGQMPVTPPRKGFETDWRQQYQQPLGSQYYGGY